MRQRLDQLPQYSGHPTEWAKLLVPIFDRSIATFDRPEGEYLKTFWLNAFHVERGGNGLP
jgi:hypothetical protein